VATGIEASERAPAPVEAPTRAFSFTAPKKPDPEPAPVAAAAPIAAPEPMPEPESQSAEPDFVTPGWATSAAPVADSPAVPTEYQPEPAAAAGDTGEGDELLLDAGAMVPEEASASAAADQDEGTGEPPVFGEREEDETPSLGGLRSRWLSGGSAKAEPAGDAAPGGPRVKLGGTLFERMSNVTRGAAKDDDDGGDAPDIPRFLPRQNNQ
jgi:cell division protein FtsZ